MAINISIMEYLKNKTIIAVFISTIILITLVIVTARLIPMNNVSTDQKQVISITPGDMQVNIPKDNTGSSSDYLNTELEDDFEWSERELALISSVERRLPYYTKDLDIVYSDLFKMFFIHKKTDQAEMLLNNFLQENQIWELYGSHKNIITFVDKDPVDTIEQATALLNKIQDNEVKQIEDKALYKEYYNLLYSNPL